MADKFTGPALGAIAAGSLFVYAGIKAYSIPQAIKNLITGASPKTGQAAGTLSGVGIETGNDAGSSGAAGAAGPAPSVAGNYSTAQLEQLWTSQGGNAGAAATAACIAMAESSGNPNAANHNSNGTEDRGLWQINSIWGAQSTFDPAANARAAISISNNGSNWSPWTTHAKCGV